MPREQWFRNLIRAKKQSETTTFQVHTYKYKCSRWYGWAEGTRSVALRPEQSGQHVFKALEQDANQITQSSDCSVTLLQIYDMTVGNIRPFAALGLGVNPPSSRVPPTQTPSKKHNGSNKPKKE